MRHTVRLGDRRTRRLSALTLTVSALAFGAGVVGAIGVSGVWVISPEGKHLGTLVLPQLPANLSWGDPEGRTDFFTARTALYRLHL